MKFLKISSLLALFLVVRQNGQACDSCGCMMHEPILFSGTSQENPLPGAIPEPKGTAAKIDSTAANKPDTSTFIFAGTQEQYTNFGNLRNDNVPVANTYHQYEQSLIIQNYVGYQFNSWSSVQVNVPYINRAYSRPSFAGTDTGTVSGIGDTSLVGNFIPYRYEAKDWGLDWALGGGVKFPTGDPHRIAEELSAGDPNSAIGGHDLAIGSGSFDGIIATGLSYHWKQFFYTAHFDYAIRSPGYLGYRYANEIGWSTGPGYEFFHEKDFIVALQFRASGESKGEDTFQGQKEDDTGITDLFLGPLFTMSWGKHLNANFGVDLPVSQDETSFQAVPDYRIRGGLTWAF